MNEILKKRIENIPYRITRVGNGANDAYNEGVRHGAEWMLSNMWISVEEALPEYDKLVLAKHKPIAGVHSYQDNISLAYIQKQGVYGIRWIINGMSWAINKSNKEDNTVLAWMPIPELKTNDNG